MQSVSIPLHVPLPLKLRGKAEIIKADYLAAMAAVNTAAARTSDLADTALMLADVPEEFWSMYAIDPEHPELGVRIVQREGESMPGAGSAPLAPQESAGEPAQSDDELLAAWKAEKAAGDAITST